MSLPPYVGPAPDGFAAHTLTCTFALRPGDPTCGLPATTHFRMPGASIDGYGVGARTCDEHAFRARDIGFSQEHPTVDSACAMPGALWSEGPPSRCVLDDSGEEPVLNASRELEGVR